MTPFIPDHLLSNPLVNPGDLPHGVPAYDRIKAEHFEPAVDWAIAEAQRRLDTVKNNGKADFATWSEILFADEELGRISSTLSEIDSVSSTPEVQETYNKKIHPKLVSFHLAAALDKDLFKKIDAIYQQRDALNLPDGYRLALEKTHQDLINYGAALPPRKAQKFKSLQERLSELEKTFSQNVLNDTDRSFVAVMPYEAHTLKGVPQDYLDFYRQKATDDKLLGLPPGAYLIPMSPPPMVILDSCEDASLRQRVFTTWKNRGTLPPYNNEPVFKEILQLRQKIAEIFGYENYADQVISTGRRMVSDYRDVMDFIKTNAAIYRPGAKNTYDALTALARADGAKSLRPCDIYYYFKKLEQQELDYDTEEAKKYLPLDKVMRGMITAFEKVYSVRFEDSTGKYPTLHPSVKTYDIYDHKSGEKKSILYVDLFAREAKRGGAWMENTRDAGLYRGQKNIPIASIHMNLKEGDDTHLSPDDVKTLYHEAGHGFHCMMGEDDVPSANGTHVGWDYVELPSQFMERFAFNYDHVKTYAINPKTGEAMPKSLLDKILSADKFDAAWAGLRQSEFGLLDMVAHTTPPGRIRKMLPLENKALAPYRVKGPSIGASQYNNFTHIMGGYGAGYYVYKWADALVANVAEIFERREAQTGDIFPPDLCKAFADHMIKPGAKIPSAQMLADFKRAAACNDLSLDPLALFRAEGVPVPAEIEATIYRRKNGLGL